MSGCKIGKVTLKGGAQLLQMPAPKRDGFQKRMIDDAIFGAGHYPGSMHGFILIAWDQETTWCSARINDASKVGISQAPAFAAEEVRRAFYRAGDW